MENTYINFTFSAYSITFQPIFAIAQATSAAVLSLVVKKTVLHQLPPLSLRPCVASDQCYAHSGSSRHGSPLKDDQRPRTVCSMNIPNKATCETRTTPQ